MKSLLAAMALVTLIAPQGKTTKPHSRQIVVTVVDRAGAPVMDLAPSDFTIREDGVTRDITNAGLAQSAMRIALMLDSGDAMKKTLDDMRLGVLRFAEAVPPPHEIMLVTTGRHVRVHVPPTTDRKQIVDAAAGLSIDGAGTALMDSLVDIDDRFMKPARDRWAVFVILTSDGTESSSVSIEKFNAWLLGLPSRGISAHAISIKYRGGGMPERVAEYVTDAADGHYESLNLSNTVPDKMAALGRQIAADYDRGKSRYQITYVTDAADLRPVSIGVAREGVRLEVAGARVH
jgi:hypothetical protein